VTSGHTMSDPGIPRFNNTIQGGCGPLTTNLKDLDSGAEMEFIGLHTIPYTAYGHTFMGEIW
jgi:hypothetical protein